MHTHFPEKTVFGLFVLFGILLVILLGSGLGIWFFKLKQNWYVHDLLDFFFAIASTHMCMQERKFGLCKVQMQSSKD